VVGRASPHDKASEDARPTIRWQALLLLAWAAVVLALLLLLLQRAWFVRGLVAQSRRAGTPSLKTTLDQCRHRMGVARPIAMRISPNATSPAVCGLLRPVILIPQSLAPRLQPHDLQAVLLHELAHIKRGDLWINLVQTLLQIVYFYNPLLWLANAMIRRTREQAVDEAVLVAMGETARDYPETLLHIAKLAFQRRPALSLRLIGVVESKSALRSRIQHILARPFPKSARLGLFGLVAVFLIAAVLLPMAKARPLTDLARNVRSMADEEARRLNHEYVGTEHILLALARQEDAVSAKVLANLGADLDTLRAEVNKFVQPGPAPVTRSTLPRMPRAEWVVQYAREEAKALGHDYIGTEHILLALLRDKDSVAAQVLARLGITETQIRAHVLTFVQPGRQNPQDNNDGSTAGAKSVSDQRADAEIWRDIGESVPADANDARALGPGVVLDGIGQDVEDKVFIACVRDAAATRDMQYRFVLHRKDGQVFEPQYYLRLDRAGGKVWEKFTFDMWYDHRSLDGFRLQVRRADGDQPPKIPLARDEVVAAASAKEEPPLSKQGPPGRYALSFDGRGDYLYIPDSESLRTPEQLTIELWIKPEFPEGSLEDRPGWAVLAKGAYTGRGRVRHQGFA
ncbi:MAG TPA: hypothetical protein ENN80_11100, partial [Candidatus Hydrogenedentes bacterium]|nr:hypothetical protein [Candidatus Hydrogenedentota bacterium]